MSKKKKPSWEIPAVMPLGSLAKGRGVGPDKCMTGSDAEIQCAQGVGARQEHCRDGSGPPTGSCGSGAGGTD